MRIPANESKQEEDFSSKASENQKSFSHDSPAPVFNNRPEAVAQRKLQEMANNSQQVTQLQAMQTMANNSTQVRQFFSFQSSLPQSSDIHENGVIQQVKGTPSPNGQHLSEEEKSAVKSYEEKLNTAVEIAYQLVVSLKFLNMPKGDAHMEKFVRDFKAFRKNDLNKERRSLLSAKAGYWIESYVTKILLPEGAEGKTSWKYQITKGKTRPDVIVYYDGKEIAALDITSLASEKHIYKKAETFWKSIPYANEVMYPAIDFSAIKKGDIPDKDDDISELVTKYHKKRSKEKAKKEIYSSKVCEIAKEILDIYRTPNKRYPEIIKAIREYFGKKFPPLSVYKILQSAGLNPKTYGFGNTPKKPLSIDISELINSEGAKIAKTNDDNDNDDNETTPTTPTTSPSDAVMNDP